MTEYTRLRRQVQLLCREAYAEYNMVFPEDPFDSWFMIAQDGQTICLNKRKYDYCMFLALEAINKASCEELVDVLYFISNERPEGDIDD